MTEDKKNQPIVSGKEITATVVAAGAAAGQALTISPAADPTALAAAAVLVALFPPVIAAISEVAIRRMRARADRFYASVVASWARDSEVTAAEIAGILEARKEDPNVADAIWRAVRALMDAPNDDAAVPLGVLAAEYARDKRAADSFFRGTVRLLAELSAQELRDLRRVVRWIIGTSDSANEVTLVAFDRDASAGPNAPDWPSVPWRVLLFDKKTSLRDPDAILEGLQDPARILSLLKNEYLAFPGTRSWYGASPMQVGIRTDIVRRLANILGDPE
ncbi:hypothetical protein KEG38_27525 [Polyangium jinanense]|uniref:hypothetical protein n=1 Tax=Polyangium jinanense TaxID=2829994 RepID=UPI0023403C3F|nr:hypothetical protein [Polyangium jinanense]MDC3957640.1 hypothetical protein [Polyangium jinanense]